MKENYPFLNQYTYAPDTFSSGKSNIFSSLYRSCVNESYDRSLNQFEFKQFGVYINNNFLLEYGKGSSSAEITLAWSRNVPIFNGLDYSNEPDIIFAEIHSLSESSPHKLHLFLHEKFLKLDHDDKELGNLCVWAKLMKNSHDKNLEDLPLSILGYNERLRKRKRRS